jgi:hypothetical protein
MERAERRLVGLTLFSLILLTISVLVVFTGFNEPYGYNIRLIFGLILWPPALITFSGCLWLMLSLRGNDAYVIGLFVGVICLFGAAASVLLLKSYPYDGHADWGVYEGLLPAMTFASISMVATVWMVSKLVGENRRLPRVYMFLLGIAILVGFLLSWFFLLAFIEFMAIAVAAGLIWGWAFDRNSILGRSRTKRGERAVVAFLSAYFVVPLSILAIPYYFVWLVFY